MCLAALAAGVRADEGVPSPAAEPARLAPHALLIALARAGERLVAVGDRGVIVRSDDRGAIWTQARAVPSEALLTGVCFFDATHGVAVGHDQVILLSADAGDTWRRTHYDPQAQGPLLDVWCGRGGRAIAVGAYSSYLSSDDGGASWTARSFSAAPIPRTQGAPAGTAAQGADQGAAGGYHLNRIVAAGPARLYIAAEAGHLYRSDDAGATWQELASPYAGSFFGVLPLGDAALLAFGLRGNLFRSEDAGASWRKLASGTVALLDGAARLGEPGVAVVGFSGVVLVSHDGGRSFSLAQQSDRAGLSAALAVAGDTIAVVGEDGARVIGLSEAPTAGAATP
jgi:photosystem II stability/assembly factor-like uncharacterized protein